MTSAETGTTVRGSSRPLTRVDADAAPLTKEQIEAIVREQTGLSIKLDAPDVRVLRANNIDDASATLRNTDNSAVR
jgi:hypothetical protein